MQYITADSKAVVYYSEALLVAATTIGHTYTKLPSRVVVVWEAKREGER